MSENPKTLDIEDTFHFSCNHGIDCFTQCCQDVNILLTPYDIIQMKNRLGISSAEFLENYTKRLFAPNTFLPAVQFKMDEENKKRCYFVGEKGGWASWDGARACGFGRCCSHLPTAKLAATIRARTRRAVRARARLPTVGSGDI